MFGFGKKKKQEATAENTASSEVQNTPAEELVAPANGRYKPLSDVSDPVFAQGMMGEGFAVEPEDGTVVAPVTGEIALLQDSLHAFMIRTPSQAEVLVHVGIDTVELEGRGFSSLVQVGQQVQAGDPVLTVDWLAIKDDIPSSDIMVMVTNQKVFGVTSNDDTPRPVTAGARVADTRKK